MKNKKQFGLIGKNIEYSFSRRFFLEKFNSNDMYLNFSYINYDIKSIEEIDNVFKQKNLCGLNVTIPYKEKIINCLDEISDQAKEIGAVNTICFDNQRKIGYNTDIFGFSKSLEINEINNIDSVLILGSGGAAKTISYFCINNNIPYNIVSRKLSNSYISYKSLNEKHFKKKVLIVNCTPIGTFPDIDRCPNLPYNLINKENVIFDLVYNPSETLLMKKGKERGCKTINGHEMLRFQAEKSLELWAETFK